MYLREGQVFEAKSHVQFLNELLGITLPEYRSSTYMYQGVSIWMIRLDGENRKGWRNTYVTPERIQQENIHCKKFWNGVPFMEATREQAIRLVIEVCEMADGEREYVFRGVYEWNEADSNLKYQYFDKIASEFEFD